MSPTIRHPHHCSLRWWWWWCSCAGATATGHVTLLFVTPVARFCVRKLLLCPGLLGVGMAVGWRLRWGIHKQGNGSKCQAQMGDKQFKPAKFKIVPTCYDGAIHKTDW